MLLILGTDLNRSQKYVLMYKKKYQGTRPFIREIFCGIE